MADGRNETKIDMGGASLHIEPHDAEGRTGIKLTLLSKWGNEAMGIPVEYIEQAAMAMLDASPLQHTGLSLQHPLAVKALQRGIDGESTLSDKQPESAREYLSRMSSNLDYEEEWIMDPLTVAGVLAFWELWNHYGTDLMSGIIESINEGDCPDMYNDWVRMHAPHLKTFDYYLEGHKGEIEPEPDNGMYAIDLEDAERVANGYLQQHPKGTVTVHKYKDRDGLTLRTYRIR